MSVSRKGLLALFGMGVVAAVSLGAAVQERTILGSLIDNETLAGVMRADDPEDAAMNVEKAVLLSDAAQKSGYTILQGKRKTKIDPGSVSTVVEYLKKDDSTIQVRVTGTTGGSGLVIKSIERASKK